MILFLSFYLSTIIGCMNFSGARHLCHQQKNNKKTPSAKKTTKDRPHKRQSESDPVPRKIFGIGNTQVF